MPQKTLGEKKKHGSWLGEKLTSLYTAWGQKGALDYPGQYKEDAYQATHAVGGAIRTLPPLSATQAASAKQGMADDMFRLQTGYDPNRLAFGSDSTF